MTNKNRSRNFPRIALSDAQELIEKLYAKAGQREVRPISAVDAMGYNSLNGRSRTVLAAVKAYGLTRNGKDSVQVSSLGLRIIRPKNDEDGASARREASFTPPVFSEIREKFGDLSENMLAKELLHEDGFSEEAANSASAIYHKNLSYSGGIGSQNEGEQEEDSIDFEGDPEDFYQKPDRPAPKPAHANPPMNPAIQYCELPTILGPVPVPKGLPKKDFERLKMALDMFEDLIVKQESEKPIQKNTPVEEIDDEPDEFDV